MKTIVVPTDFSEYAIHAVNFGIELGRLTGAKVDVIHSVPTFIDWAYLPKDKEKDYAEIKHVISEAKSKLSVIEDDPAHKDVTIKTHLYYEASHDAILKHVDNVGGDLLVMGSHGHSGFSKYFLGSTAQKAIRLAKCPVLTVKQKTHVQDLQSLVFASDFEEDITGAFQQVQKIRMAIGGTIDLLTVLTPLQEAGQQAGSEVFNQIDQEEYQDAHTIHIHTYQTVEEGIQSFVREKQFGAVALGTHAWTGIQRLLHWGSIAENLVNHAPFPVITVRL